MISVKGRQDGITVISPHLTCRAHVRGFTLETGTRVRGRNDGIRVNSPRFYVQRARTIVLKPTPSDVSGGQYFLGRFSAEIGTQQGFHAWSDIQEFKAIPTDDYRYFKAKQVNKYFGSMWRKW